MSGSLPRNATLSLESMAAEMKFRWPRWLCVALVHVRFTSLDFVFRTRGWYISCQMTWDAKIHLVGPFSQKSVAQRWSDGLDCRRIEVDHELAPLDNGCIDQPPSGQ